MWTRYGINIFNISYNIVKYGVLVEILLSENISMKNIIIQCYYSKHIKNYGLFMAYLYGKYNYP